MSCGDHHETDCSEVLGHLYEYLDREMPDSDCAKFQEHFEECSPCLEKYGLEEEVKKLVKRCCGHDDVPSGLRSKVMGRIELIRSAEAAGAEGPGGRAESEAADAQPPSPSQASAQCQSKPQAQSQSVAGRKKYA